jgi:hypothetical protein
VVTRDQAALPSGSVLKQTVRQVLLVFPQYFLFAFVAIAAVLATMYGLARVRFRFQAPWLDAAEHAMEGYAGAFTILRDQWVAKLFPFRPPPVQFFAGNT